MKTKTLDKTSILEELKDLKPRLAKFGVSELGLFGSYVRNEQNEGSDIDILIDFDPKKKSFDNFMVIYDLLEESFSGEKVEVLTRKGLSPYLGPNILETVEYV
jgi:predicted nucleotidyltransferase